MTTTSLSAIAVAARTPADTKLYCGGHEPIFLAAIVFSAGIIAGNYLWRSPLQWLVGFVIAVAAGILLYRRFPQGAFFLLLLSLCPLGGFYLQARDAAAPTVAEDLQPFGDGETPVEVIAYVIREGLVRDSPYGGQQESVDVNTERLQRQDRSLSARIGIRLTIYSKKTEEEGASPASTRGGLPTYIYGQRLQFTGRLRIPRDYRNPGAMNLTGYLASQGIQLTGSADGGAVAVLPGFIGSRIGLWRSTARRSVLEHIMQLWPGERGALMQAALIGGRAFFGREIKTEFQRTGTYHILVVSGINVGILAFAAFWGLRKLPFGNSGATILTILLSWGYAFLADLGSPIVRATITLDIYLVTRLLFRDRSGLNGLGIAALGILLVNPRTLFEASFQLTFLSVLAVAGITVPVLRHTLYPLQKALRNLDSPALDVTLPPGAAQFRFDVRLVRDLLKGMAGVPSANLVVIGGTRFLLAAIELLFISTVIQLALALPMVWYFHRATTMALPANALVIPIAQVLLPSAVLAVAASYLGGWLAWLPALVARYALDALTGTIHVIGHMRISEVRVPTPSLPVCCLAALAMALAMIFCRQKRPWPAIGLAGLLAAAIWMVVLPPKPHWRPGVLEVTAIDVGQGDSLFLVTPEGKSLLMDAGGLPGYSRSDFDVGEEVVSSYLWSRGFDHVDAVAISHAHSDHVGGMRSVIANFQPRELWYGMESPTPEFQAVKHAAQANHTELKAHTAGDTFAFGGVQIRVLNPQPGWEAHNPAQDDESLVLRLQYGATSVLMMGDSHRRIEKLLLHQRLQSDLLKVGHHGSLTSSSPEFLNAVQPRFAVVSVGFYNSFHLPRPEVMQRYAAAHTETYRTDLSGAVSFYLDGKNITAAPTPR